MGQTLSEPITSKESAALQNAKVKVGSSSMQGWRISMEDAHTHILKLNEDPDAMFFGVYDGHGGGKIAAHVSKHLHKFILKQPEYKQGDYETAISKGFLECDEAMRTDESLKDEMSGSTAITALVRGNNLFTNNVGDSRCIASVGGVAQALSIDHKPGDEKERKRIEDAGGFVEFNRVNGNLALSRALGDFVFKNNENRPAEEQIVSGCPEIDKRFITEDWEFVLLACDGIWDVLGNQEVADFVLKRIAKAMEPEDICEELMTRCLAADCTMGGLGCDNMTVILVCLLHGQPYQRLVDRCASLVKKKEGERNQSPDDDGEEDNDDEGKSPPRRQQQQQQPNGDCDDSPTSSSSSPGGGGSKGGGGHKKGAKEGDDGGEGGREGGESKGSKVSKLDDTQPEKAANIMTTD